MKKIKLNSMENACCSVCVEMVIFLFSSPPAGSSPFRVRVPYYHVGPEGICLHSSNRKKNDRNQHVSSIINASHRRSTKKLKAINKHHKYLSIDNVTMYTNSSIILRSRANLYLSRKATKLLTLNIGPDCV